MEMNQKNKTNKHKKTKKKLRRLCLKQPKIKMQLQENYNQVADFTTARMEVRRQLNIMFKSLRNYNCQSRAKQNSGMRVKKKKDFQRITSKAKQKMIFLHQTLIK